MSYDYIYSIISLYVKNETDDKKVNLNLTKTSKKVVLKFNMKKEDDNKTTFDLPYEVVNNYIENILNIVKENLLIIDEKYELDSQKKYCYYYVKFSNGRILSFNNFSIVEINNIRNILYNINLRRDEIRIELDAKEEVKMNYKPRLQESGFISHSSLFLMVLYLADAFMISLWIFKVLIIDK